MAWMFSGDLGVLVCVSVSVRRTRYCFVS